MILDVPRGLLIDGDFSIQLSRAESALVQALAAAPDGVSCAAINALIYPGNVDHDPGNLSVLVCRFRTKCRGAGINLIETLRGFGFRLTVRVEIIRAEPAVLIPGDHRRCLEILLYSHPDRVLADRILVVLAAQ